MRTNEIILTGLMMLLLLTVCSCSSDSPNGMPEPNTGDKGDTVGQGPAVGFSAVFAEKEEQRSAGARTRSVGDGEFDDDALQASGFGVYCWYTGTKDYATGSHIKDYTKTILMLNQKVEYKNAQWTYSPTKYWPLNDEEKLTLRAYAPYVSYQLQTDEVTGLPWLPVVVKDDDYHNGTQHDPLWGTAKYGGTDGDEGTTYGVLYDNYTHVMSGNELVKDGDDGIVHWYFHHGMSKLMFTCSLVKDPGCEKVVIRSITITPLYTQGLLSLSSPTANKNEKPEWTEKDGNMTVTLEENKDDNTTAGDFAPTPDPNDPGQPHPTKPYPFVLTTANDKDNPVDLLGNGKGLLIIPRTYTGGDDDKFTVTITYSVDDDSDEQTATAELGATTFYGNTAYTLNFELTPSTRGLEITMVQGAFTAWKDGGEGDHTVYNW